MREYMWCKACGNIVYRDLGKHHGDGQIDSDSHPVWLTGDEEMLEEDNLTIDDIPEGYCGCND